MEQTTKSGTPEKTESATQAAGHRLVQFITQDEGMMNMTRQEIFGVLRYAQIAIGKFFFHRTLREVIEAGERRTQEQRSLNWTVLAIPENCQSIFVCTDGDLFDERVKNGLTPLHDDRDRESETSVPCFIGYAPNPNPKCLDTLAGLQTAKQGEAQSADSHSHEVP